MIEAAARLFRERSPDGIGLTELMQAAGLRHGGFYKKFASRDDLCGNRWIMHLQRRSRTAF